MPVKECPHCHNRVYVKGDGMCPACSADTNDATGADTSVTRVDVHIRTRIPDICMGCGDPTKDRTHFDLTRRVGQDDWWVRALLVVGSLLTLNPGLAVNGLAASQGEREFLELDLPVCGRCRRQGKAFKPEHIDHKGERAVFLVDTLFSEALRAANAG